MINSTVSKPILNSENMQNFINTGTDVLRIDNIIIESSLTINIEKKVIQFDDIEYSFNQDSITLKNIEIIDTFFIKGINSNNISINISHCSFLKNVNINLFNNLNLSIYRSEFLKEVNFTEIRETSTDNIIKLSIENSTFNSFLKLLNTQDLSLFFSRNTCKRSLNIEGGANSITIKDSEIFKIILDIYKDLKYCLIRLCKISKDYIKFVNTNINELIFSDCTFENEGVILFEGSNIKILDIKDSIFSKETIYRSINSNVENLFLDFSGSTGALLLQEWNIGKCKLYGENKQLSVIFQGCKFCNLEFEKFYNYSTIVFQSSEIAKNAILSIKSSNLGKMHFFNFQFNLFTKVIIENSVLLHIIYINVIWFDDSKLETIGYRNRRVIYRQLSLAATENGSKVDELYFKAQKKTAYKNELIFDNKKQWWNMDVIALSSGETNNYGQDWVKPLKYILSGITLFHFLIFSFLKPENILWDKLFLFTERPFLVLGILLIIIYYKYFNTSKAIFKWEIWYPLVLINLLIINPEWKYSLHSSFPILNPTYRFSFTLDDLSITKIDKTTYNYFMASTLFYTSKIYFTFFYFQMIKAFRKFAE